MPKMGERGEGGYRANIFKCWHANLLKEIKAASAYHNIAIMWYSVVMVILQVRTFETSSSQLRGTLSCYFSST